MYDEIGEGRADDHVWLGPGELPDQTAEIEASGLFDVALVRQLDWETTYDADCVPRAPRHVLRHIAMEVVARDHCTPRSGAGCTRPTACCGGTGARPPRGRALVSRAPTSLSPCVPGPLRTCPHLPVPGPPVALHDTPTGALVTTTPRRSGPDVRLRHHAVRRHPPRPRGDLRRLRPAQPGLAQRRPRGRSTSQNVTDVDDPLLERATKVGRRLGRARRARDRAVPAGHDRAAGAAAGALHRRGRVDPARRRR